MLDFVVCRGSRCNCVLRRCCQGSLLALHACYAQALSTAPPSACACTGSPAAATQEGALTVAQLTCVSRDSGLPLADDCGAECTIMDACTSKQPPQQGTHAASAPRCTQVMHHHGFFALAPSMAALAWLGVLLAVGGLGLLYCTTTSDPGFIPQGATAPARAGHRGTEGRKSTPTGGSGGESGLLYFQVDSRVHDGLGPKAVLCQ